ncbi:hypothetical protein Syun_012372 [Stephania yunnanensis]|uniref:Uncharacterized protein n=1 Tax=Stephania yunnanensis TaxID=152371 RepID=A0AAP0PGC4_9MAGN
MGFSHGGRGKEAKSRNRRKELSKKPTHASSSMETASSSISSSSMAARNM